MGASVFFEFEDAGGGAEELAAVASEVEVEADEGCEEGAELRDEEGEVGAGLIFEFN